NEYLAQGAVLRGGSLDLAEAAFAKGWLLHSGCVEDGTTRTRLPAEGDRVRHEDGNLLLG
ncbi:hypothetical protein G3I76_06160, partial [Streptomyces sp. SID11233]|nr:hypothetical protein [Streptomyces sp. SID11233]